MIIQGNMSPKAIVEVWEETRLIFQRNNIPLSNKALEKITKPEDLSPLLIELNNLIGSTSATCIEGG
ncbi:hypothetical protein [Alkalicoccus saliphilus]|uniref:Uncharacterized protein n=1 Tax=Alkalicoccus saliphilus TaxID=200989 RepID=A0A2T4U6U7_9BACI|nr:hypothetical protein [Alkalicoccus saliphilus]PTL39114.1 hypothetical protein C6Y45_08010 [Alkalicoccus saliphilus]